MKYLEKLTISNIRRFSENVEIEIGKGATIFLAPNGTGKTAIFEAIELALTGKVKRLLYPKEALIRDGCTESNIRLDFDDNKFCSAVLKKGMEPVLAGNHNEIFGSIQSADQPFLLQLTHFLNQRSDSWFVQSHGETAGSQLEHLSIGREASEVIKLIPSAKKAAGNMLVEAQREFDEISIRLSEWQQLLEKRRSGGGIELSSTLVASATLLERLNAIAIQIKDQLPGESDDLLTLKVYAGKLASMSEQIRDRFNRDAISLESLSILIQDFNSLQELLSVARERLAVSRQAKSSIETAKLGIQQQLAQHVASIQQTEASLRKAQSDNFHKGNLDRVNEELRLINERRPTLELHIDELSQQVTNSEATLTGKVELAALHEALEERLGIAEQEGETINLLVGQLQYWQEYVSYLDHVEQNVLPCLLFYLSELELNLNGLKQNRQVASRNLENAEQSFDTLNRATDNIRSAIGIIITSQDPSQGDCPVCGAEYEPTELQRRMQDALNLLDPNVRVASRLVESSKISLSEIVRKLRVTEDEHVKVTDELDRIGTRMADINDYINRNVLPHFEECLTPEDGEVRIADLITSYTENKKALEVKQLELTAKPSAAEISQLRESRLVLNERLLNAINELNQTAVRVTDLTASQQSFTVLVSELGNLDDLNERIMTIESRLNTLRLGEEHLRLQLNLRQNEVDLTDEEITRQEITISELSTRVSEKRTVWLQNGLAGEPSETSLSTAREALRINIERWTNNVIKIDDIQTELTRWQVMEDHLKTESEIVTFRAGIDEQTFGIQLGEEVGHRKLKLESITQKIKALGAFANHLEGELRDVHERIRSINPLWQKLLKRIVVDPRFGETTLDNYNKNRKQHANVHVKLNGSDIFVSEVASEAQITDLQLTFLLAMAQKHQWSPWRGLLLDDPTQHHDLVHASAVFDLLRDYIAEHEFQVLLATHDTVQARFFMRKLENDGIPVKLYTLYAEDGGVKARISS